MNNIKNYRLEKEMKLEELAKMVGVSTGYLCHLEKGTRRNPSIDVMERIAKVLNKTIADVFFPEDKK